MKKTIVGVTAAAFLASATLPASAWVPLLMLPMAAGLKSAEKAPAPQAKVAKAKSAKKKKKM